MKGTITPEGLATMPKLELPFNGVQIDPHGGYAWLTFGGVRVYEWKLPKADVGDTWQITGISGTTKIELSQ